IQIREDGMENLSDRLEHSRGILRLRVEEVFESVERMSRQIGSESEEPGKRSRDNEAREEDRDATEQRHLKDYEQCALEEVLVEASLEERREADKYRGHQCRQHRAHKSEPQIFTDDELVAPDRL